MSYIFSGGKENDALPSVSFRIILTPEEATDIEYRKGRLINIKGVSHKILSIRNVKIKGNQIIISGKAQKQLKGSDS